MYIFQSVQVIINCNSVLKITSLIFKSPDLNPLDYHVWGAILRCSTHHNQLTLLS